MGWGVSSNSSTGVFEWCLVGDGRMPAFMDRREGTGDGDSRGAQDPIPMGLYQVVMFPGPTLLSLPSTQILLWSRLEDV